MKRTACLVLSLLLSFSLLLPACADAETRVFTDSLGREVAIPVNISRIAVTGALGRITLFAIAPDLLVGLPDPWDAAAKAYIPEKYHDLPTLGQIYGGKGALNLEELLNVAPEVVIDIGEAKDGTAEDLDELMQQTGLPWVHISAPLDGLDQTYRMLGDLLGLPEEGNALAEYCRRTYDMVTNLTESVEKVDLLYVLGEKGLNVLAKGSFHSAIIDMMANNLAVVDHPQAKGTGNEVDMEQILVWNPDIIIFADDSIFDTAADDPLWQNITAIQNGAYYETPVGPFNWMGMPPSVQRLLGLLWMGKLFYPDQATYDLYEETAQYYKLFYHWELTQEQFDTLMAHSLTR